MAARGLSVMLGLLAMVVAVGAAQQWLANSQADEHGSVVAALAAPGDIEMISSQTCAICDNARAWFQRNEVAYHECTIETDADCRARFGALGAGGTPVMVVRGKPQLGFSPARLQAALQAGSKAQPGQVSAPLADQFGLVAAEVDHRRR